MTNLTLIFCRIGAYRALDLKLLEVLEHKIEVLFVIVGEENSFFSFTLLGSVPGACKLD